MLADKKTEREVIPDSLSDMKRSDLGEEFARLQRQLEKTDKSMLVIVDGWESSGKGYLLKDLTRELDPKYYEVEVFGETSQEERDRHYLYRFFKKAPYHGQMAFFDRSFYYELFTNTDISDEDLQRLIQSIGFIEEALLDDDTLIVKFFLHHTEEEMAERIEELEEDDYAHVLLTDIDYQQLENYDKFYAHFDKILEQTNYQRSPWNILYIDGKKDTSRKALQICIDRLSKYLEGDYNRLEPKLASLPKDEDLWPLNRVDLSAEISDDDYDDQLEDLQKRAGELLYQVYLENKAIVVAYEGTDAAGKGGNIERLTRHMDPRGYDVETTSAPSQVELDHHYLWRFNEGIPPRGRMTIFDRTWYGRVLVERVEGLTPVYRWKEAYQEINKMEANLVQEGFLVLKYLLIIDKDEQLERFEDRAEDPDKQHKLTDEDWRNREKFDDYKLAMNEMVYHTSTDEAPWKVISGQQKEYARIAVLKDFIERVEAYLEGE